MEGVAKFISWFFLPLFVPVYGLLIVLFLPIPSTVFDINASLFMLHPMLKLLFILLFVIFIVLAPGLSIIVMKKNKTISSLEMEKREERFAPIILMVFYSLVLFFFLNFLARNTFIPPLFKGMVLGGAIASLISLFVTKKMKISLHGIGMGMLFGFLYMFALPLEYVPIYLLTAILILGGIVMSARLFLNAHSLREVGWGYALGILSQILCIHFINIV